jgi:hypothetical protein
VFLHESAAAPGLDNDPEAATLGNGVFGLWYFMAAQRGKRFSTPSIAVRRLSRLLRVRSRLAPRA